MWSPPAAPGVIVLSHLNASPGNAVEHLIRVQTDGHHHEILIGTTLPDGAGTYWAEAIRPHRWMADARTIGATYQTPDAAYHAALAYIRSH